MNAGGGTLVIAVADGGAAVGTEKDGNVERFYIRPGASATDLSARQTNKHIGRRFRG